MQKPLQTLDEGEELLTSVPSLVGNKCTKQRCFFPPAVGLARPFSRSETEDSAFLELWLTQPRRCQRGFPEQIGRFQELQRKLPPCLVRFWQMGRALGKVAPCNEGGEIRGWRATLLASLSFPPSLSQPHFQGDFPPTPCLVTQFPKRTVALK